MGNAALDELSSSSCSEFWALTNGWLEERSMISVYNSLEFLKSLAASVPACCESAICEFKQKKGSMFLPFSPCPFICTLTKVELPNNN